MTRPQVAWAAQHDWFVRSITTDHIKWAVLVEDRDNVQRHPDRMFTDYRALREWAGY